MMKELIKRIVPCIRGKPPESGPPIKIQGTGIKNERKI